MSTCSDAEIAAKKRIAQERLRASKAQKKSANVNDKSSCAQTKCIENIKKVALTVNAQQNSQKLQAAIKTSTTTLTPKISNRTTATVAATTTITPQTPNLTNATNVNNIDNLSTKKCGSFYKSPNNAENKATTFLESLKNSNVFTHRKEARNSTHPYQRSTNTKSNDDKMSLLTLSPKNQQLAPIFPKSIGCRIYMISAGRFMVQPASYHEKLIEVFKSIPSRSYDHTTRNWSFALKDYDLLQQRMITLKPGVVIGAIPKAVINLCLAPIKELNCSYLASIEPTLATKLLPFQEEGVCFAIAQHGRIMICDEMGLGKTYQALAVADFYKENWPLLICTTASTRESWANHVRELLPKVPCHYIQVLSSTEYIGDAKVLITSYNMMERHVNKLLEIKFGFLIFDESHTLKNSKAKCTNASERLAGQAKHVILLSGTPALSRPVELYTQLHMIDRKFMNFIDFTTRYCDAKQTNFGWDTSGQSNLEELNVILKLKFMIRRTKADVLPQMSEKSRETVILDDALIWRSDDTKETINHLSRSFTASKGKEREALLLKFYAQTAEVKRVAVCAYLKVLLKEHIKFIVFAHHRVMLDAISECLNKLCINYVRIDGSTKNDARAEFINCFQKKSSCKVAVLSLNACNSGITLTAAEMIVFAELAWNPSTLAQAESRAHRIGQEKPVVCRYLMAAKTADDVIWNMLKSKQDVLNKAGIFCENLQEATQTIAPTISNKIEQYFTTDKLKLQTNDASEKGQEHQIETVKMNDTKQIQTTSLKATEINTNTNKNINTNQNVKEFSLTQELKNINEIFKDDNFNDDDDVDFFKADDDDDIFKELVF